LRGAVYQAGIIHMVHGSFNRRKAGYMYRARKKFSNVQQLYHIEM
jgi:hypothetical protein